MVQTINDLSMLLGVIRMLPESIHPSIIAVSGFGGSGKTTLADTLATQLDNAVVITTDDFILPSYAERSDEWDCVDRDRILAQVLQPAAKSEPIRYQAFDWATHTLGEWRTVPGNPNYVIIEGVGLVHPELAPYFHFSIWIDCPIETAMKRGISRDEQLMHVDDADLWQDVWVPNDRDFFDKLRPDELVDCLYDGTHPLEQKS